MNVTYKFQNMVALADYLLAKAVEARQAALRPGIKQASRVANMAEAGAFEAASSIVRNTEITNE